MSHTTQCPNCQTKFKVTDAHLALAAGMVRCGRCNHVFHAPSFMPEEAAPVEASQPTRPPVAPTPPLDDDFELELPDFQPEAAAPAVSPAPPPASPAVREEDFNLPDFDLMEPEQAAMRPPAITADFRAAAADAEVANRRSELDAFQQALSDALRPASRLAGQTPSSLNNPFETDTPPARERAPAPDMDAEEADEDRQAPQPAIPEDAPAERPHFHTYSDPAPEDEPARNGVLLRQMAVGLLAIVLLLGLLGQIAFINRTRISAEVPELRAVFEAACAPFGCQVALPTDRQLIRTEWSELSFVPQHDNLIQLNATLKNLAGYPQAFPLLELTLKDADDRVVIRKTFTPQEYIAKQDLALGQFNAHSELKLLLRLEVTQGKPQGYSLHFFYP